MNFLELLNTSPINYVILAIHIIATYLFFYRYFDLHRINLDTEDFLLGLKNNLRRGEKDSKFIEAISICDDTNTPMSSVAKSILSKNSTNELLLHHAAEEAATIEIPKLQKNMRLIASIGQIVLLLGLLGTLLSLMELFDTGSAAGLSLRDMGPTVQKALITTTLGIISAMLVHFYNVILMERCNSIVGDMQKTAIELINFLTNDPEFVNRINSGSLSAAPSEKA